MRNMSEWNNMRRALRITLMSVSGVTSTDLEKKTFSFPGVVTCLTVTVKRLESLIIVL